MTKLSVLVAAAGLVASSSAVTITLYASSNCRNAYGSCTNILQSTCCKDTYNSFGFDSAAIAPLQYYDIGAVYTVSGSKKCGTIKDSQNGPITCLSPTNANGLDGASWFDCTTCTSKRSLPVPDEFAVGQPGNCTASVSPDKLTFVDGHQFEIGSTTPANVTALLYRYALRDAIVTDLPHELLAYEVEHEGVQTRAAEIASRNA